MKRRRISSAIGLAVGAVVAAACSSTSRPPSEGSADAGSVATVFPGGPGSPPHPTTGDAAAGNATPMDAAQGDDAANDASGDVGSALGAPRCDAMHAWSSVGSVPSVPQMNFGRFGGISIDELTIAWTSATGAIYTADRAARGDHFAAPVRIDPLPTAVANDRVALAPTGLTLFAVAANRSTFVAIHRPTVGAAWSVSAPLQFVRVSAMASTDGAGQFFEPVLGADGGSFFYLLAPTGGSLALYESKWDPQQHSWTAGVAFRNADLSMASAMLRRRATGASSDGRTLFFFDETTGQQRAAWRATATSPFVQFVDIKGVAEAAPNLLCDTLYYQGTDLDSGSAGAFMAQ